jgi:alkylation response protein AidB-like acyl-CoA dehydrogenase
MHKDPASLTSDAFRALLRDWLHRYCPDTIRRPFDRLLGAEALEWHKLRHAHGLAAPGWPREYGGMALPVRHQIVLLEEFERHGVARFFDMGVAMLGPTLIKFGTDAQKRHYLPRILSGEDTWCQGYSEPGAGSDLASLTTTALRDGDHYVINGQKAWTSNAHHATHCFVLARTSREERKQQGISFLLVDLRLPGVRVHPLENLAGHEELCDVFYDEVRVPAASLVGAEGQGWAIAKSLLGYERLAIGSPGPARLAISSYRRIAAALGLGSDARVRDEQFQLDLRLHALTCLFRTAVEAVAAGQPIDADLSVLKLVSSELVQSAAAKAMALAAEQGATGSIDTPEGPLDLQQLFMISLPTTIFGGSSEVQRNILAKHWLHLPNS